MSIVNVKASVEEVKQSVTQRLNYINQTLRNNKVKENQYTVHQIIKPLESGQYGMEAEVVVEFHNVLTFENTTNWLVEKLKSSVSVSQPVFYHSPGKLSELRIAIGTQDGTKFTLLTQEEEQTSIKSTV